jgi:hypothetical protein
MLTTQDIDYDILARDILSEINLVRSNPKSYIPKLERARQFFKDRIFRHPAEIPIETYEGVDGIETAIEFLENQQSVPELRPVNELARAAKDHAIDLGSKGLSSHEGSDGSSISDRIERYIEWDGAIAENLDFCYKFAQNVVMNLIVDDGSVKKHQRHNLFDPTFKYVGVGCDKHKTFKHCSVITFAKGLHAIGDEPTDVVDSVRDYIDKTMNKGEGGKQCKNPFQVDDIDAPDNTVSVKLMKIQKEIKGVKRNITRKIYLLDDGKQHIVEIEEKE